MQLEVAFTSIIANSNYIILVLLLADFICKQN